VGREAAEALRIVFLESVLKRVDPARRDQDFATTRVAAKEMKRRLEERTEQPRALAARTVR
jgi:hypothetical protein